MQLDRRKVQTAVLGGPDSTDPAYMPQDQDEAERFRDQARLSQSSYWCGRWLGGCGQRLVIKVYQRAHTVPHFAHQTSSELCTRQHRGRDSADHLYAGRHLSSLLRSSDLTAPEPRYLTDTQELCTQLLLPATDPHLRPLRLVFSSGYDPELLALAKSFQAHTYEWWVKDNPSLTRALVANGVGYRLFRLVERDGVRVVEIASPANVSTRSWDSPETVLISRTLPPQSQQEPAVPASSSRQTAASVSDGVIASIRGLQHFLDSGSVRDIRYFRDRLQQALNDHPTPLPADVHDQARHLLDQAGQALPVAPAAATSPARATPPRLTPRASAPRTGQRKTRKARPARPAAEPPSAPASRRRAEPESELAHRDHDEGSEHSDDAGVGSPGIQSQGPPKVRRRANSIIAVLHRARRAGKHDVYMRARDQLRLIQYEPDLPADFIEAVRDQLSRFPPLDPAP